MLSGGDENGGAHPLKTPEKPGTPASFMAPNDVTSTRKHSPKPSQSIDLQALLSSGPHELEAETHILRAVEKMTATHQRTQTETARLYATIAEDDITRALDNGEILDSDNVQAENEKPDVTANTDAESVTYVPSSDSDTPATADQPTTDVGKANLLETVEASRDGDVTIEQTLFGFSNALTQMDTGSRKRTSVMGTFDAPLKGADQLAAAIDEHIQEELGNAGDVEEGGSSVTLTESSAEIAAESSRGKKKKRSTLAKETQGARKLVSKTAGGFKDDFELFSEFIGGKKKDAKAYARMVFLFIVLPSFLVAAFLFYVIEDTKKDPDTGKTIPGQDASISWWILYVGCRLPVTLSMALATQELFFFLALGSRFSLKWFGPMVTLFVVQSKGWPFVSIFWGAYNLILLAGDKAYVNWWLHWQDFLDLCNSQNPSGDVLNSDTNYTILRWMIVIGVVVSIKRLVVGLFLGRQTFAHFGQELATVMKNMVLIGAVATLARDIEKDSRFYASQARDDPDMFRSQSAGWAEPNTISDFVNREADAALEEMEESEKNNAPTPSAAAAASDFIKKRNSKELHLPPEIPDTQKDNPATDKEFTASEQVAISELLDAWEEPTRAEDAEDRKITIGAVMSFRQALTFMKRKYPFLPAFGPADTRERCIKSSQAVYERLLLRTPNHTTLPFETLALLAKDNKGGINQDKAKELIRIFRPERDGSIGKLEFVKSIDTVYKQLRLLSANISNSSQIDKAIESLVNVVFYIFLGCIVLSALGSNPRAIFFSFSSVLLGFTFMFGASSAKYFEGLLFILVQRPYGVGDRIHLSNPQNETTPNGSSCWIVEKVSLTTTTVYWGTTNERATLNNGAIANLRVINAARSPNATIFVELKFTMDTPYEKIAIFRTAVEQFLKERPREWLTFVGFRPTEVAVDRGFIGYKVIAQHRNSWQGIGGVLTSKADLTTYCMEVAKQLDMRYHAPPLPVDLSMKGTASDALQVLQGNRGGGLDQAKINRALEAGKARRGPHEAFDD